MKYNKIFQTALSLVYLAGTMLGTACQDDPAPVPTLEIKPGGSDPKADTLRLISYNILEGMKLDKPNNYDNFVAWVIAQDPDILALEEANKFTQASLEALSARYGHNYVVTNLKSDDNYPVALTSKHPIEIVQKITQRVSHGAIHAKIKGINIVVLHTWPQGYAPTDPKNSNYSPTAKDGEAYRVEEIEIFLDKTIRQYPKEQYWLMMGDFNSVSPLDADAYASGRNYDVHTVVLGSGYYDCLRELHHHFIRSTPTVYGGWIEGTSVGKSRIDFIYGSKAMIPNLTRSEIIMDDFSNANSDHFPCLIEFRHYTE